MRISRLFKLCNGNAPSIAETCIHFGGILKIASVKSVQLGNKFFLINRIIRCIAKLLPLGFLKFALVLIL